MSWILQLTRDVSRIMALGGGLFVAAAALLIVVEIALRATGGTFGGIEELSSFALAVGTTWSLAYCLVERGHVRIETIYKLLPGWPRLLLDLASLSLLVIVSAVLTWHAGQILALALSFSSRSLGLLQAPLWIPQGLWTIGFGWLCLTSIVLLAATVDRIKRGDIEGATNLSGIPMLDEELLVEIADLKRREQPS